MHKECLHYTHITEREREKETEADRSACPENVFSVATIFVPANFQQQWLFFSSRERSKICGILKHISNKVAIHVLNLSYECTESRTEEECCY